MTAAATSTATSRLILCPANSLALAPSARLDPSVDDPEETESHRIVVNTKLLDEAVKRCSTSVLFIETDKIRATMSTLYNDAWDACLMHKKPTLDCRVISTAAASEHLSKRLREQEETPVYSLETLRPALEDELNLPYCLFDNPKQPLPRLPIVALGGTFDRLHNGHKKLLAVAMQVVTQTLVVGVTAPSMLVSKKNASLIQDLDTRLAHVKEFCEAICPTGISVEVLVIDDPWGPTVSRSNVQGIVVSSETLHGAKVINDMRVQKGFAPLIPVVVLRSNQYVLSSSFVRTLL